MPAGRPSEYTQDKADIICEQLARGDSMRKVCAKEDMPAMSTVFRWLREHEEFRKQYETAKDEAADVMVEEINEIADNSTNDFMADLSETLGLSDLTVGELTESQLADLVGKHAPEHIQRSRLRVDARKWTASKLKPKKYGDKVQQEVSGPEGGPIQAIEWSMLPVTPINKADETDPEGK